MKISRLVCHRLLYIYTVRVNVLPCISPYLLVVAAFFCKSHFPSVVPTRNNPTLFVVEFQGSTYQHLHTTVKIMNYSLVIAVLLQWFDSSVLATDNVGQISKATTRFIYNNLSDSDLPYYGYDVLLMNVSGKLK